MLIRADFFVPTFSNNTRSQVYSLIAQKDALDTKKIAVLTRRDSTDMRSIAAVTLVFLPGTFTSVRKILTPALKAAILPIQQVTYSSN